MLTALDWSEILTALAPEIIFSAGILVALMVGAFYPEPRRASSARVCVLGFSAVALLALVFDFSTGGLGRADFSLERFAFGGVSELVKILLLVAMMTCLMLSVSFQRAAGFDRFEYPVLMSLSVLGMFMLVSASGLLSLYIGLELQSLCLYVLCAFNREDKRATEAALKYFVLGSLASGLMLYGMSLLYGFSGRLDFGAVAALFVEGGQNVEGVRFAGSRLGASVGLGLLLIGLCFKLSTVPFHAWTPDVYEGAPTPVVAFFATAPKLAVMMALARVLFEAFSTVPYWTLLLSVLAVASMVLGAFAALRQENIKRLLAYSTIGHVGYALLGLIANSRFGMVALSLYMFVYVITNLGVFACLLSMRTRDLDGTTYKTIDSIEDFRGLAQTRPFMALCLLVLLFSLVGIPPLGGFFAKFFVFSAVLEEGLAWLAIIGVLTSVVSAYYYLRLVRLMYFEPPVLTPAPPEPVHRFVFLSSSLVVLLFMLLQSYVLGVLWSAW